MHRIPHMHGLALAYYVESIVKPMGRRHGCSEVPSALDVSAIEGHGLPPGIYAAIDGRCSFLLLDTF